MFVRPIKRLYRLCNAHQTDRVLSYGAPRKSRSEDRTFSLTEGAILNRSKSQRTRTDFQSVATFMIVLIMKLMPQIG